MASFDCKRSQRVRTGILVGELHHELGGWKSDDVVGGLVVIEMIVIILQEKHRCRAKVCRVDRGNLGIPDPLEHSLVVAAKHHIRAVEFAGEVKRLRRLIGSGAGRC